MRVDNKIIQQIDITKARERDTACCIRNDDSGCVQSSQADCSVSYGGIVKTCNASSFAFFVNAKIRGLRPTVGGEII